MEVRMTGSKDGLKDRLARYRQIKHQRDGEEVRANYTEVQCANKRRCSYRDRTEVCKGHHCTWTCPFVPVVPRKPETISRNPRERPSWYPRWKSRVCPGPAFLVKQPSCAPIRCHKRCGRRHLRHLGSRCSDRFSWMPTLGPALGSYAPEYRTPFPPIPGSWPRRYR